MKRILALVLVLVMLCSCFAGCGKSKTVTTPTLTYLYNTSEGHKAIGEYLQSALAAAGLTMNLENQEWATFLETRKNGDYSVARNGWVADYNRSPSAYPLQGASLHSDCWSRCSS